MKWFRFSIAGQMAFIIYVAIGLAAFSKVDDLALRAGGTRARTQADRHRSRRWERQAQRASRQAIGRHRGVAGQRGDERPISEAKKGMSPIFRFSAAHRTVIGLIPFSTVIGLIPFSCLLPTCTESIDP